MLPLRARRQPAKSFVTLVSVVSVALSRRARTGTRYTIRFHACEGKERCTNMDCNCFGNSWGPFDGRTRLESLLHRASDRMARVDSTFLIRGQVVLISVIDRIGSER